ncbi:hypothetical protein BDN72DRAFT_834862 [Pluteus cervinus]|uniref:Uncharacterized protein n=1 Tax=Pluteus cervinus TaxID=181527 RepID=A0ACD3B6B6_9AGAR|nr:hypothetical protein BDN72DRAFT_834862 [Pluteus cervinus]
MMNKATRCRASTSSDNTVYGHITVIGACRFFCVDKDVGDIRDSGCGGGEEEGIHLDLGLGFGFGFWV